MHYFIIACPSFLIDHQQHTNTPGPRRRRGRARVRGRGRACVPPPFLFVSEDSARHRPRLGGAAGSVGGSMPASGPVSPPPSGSAFFSGCWPPGAPAALPEPVAFSTRPWALGAPDAGASPPPAASSDCAPTCAAGKLGAGRARPAAYPVGVCSSERGRRRPKPSPNAAVVRPALKKMRRHCHDGARRHCQSAAACPDGPPALWYIGRAAGRRAAGGAEPSERARPLSWSVRSHRKLTPAVQRADAHGGDTPGRTQHTSPAAGRPHDDTFLSTPARRHRDGQRCRLATRLRHSLRRPLRAALGAAGRLFCLCGDRAGRLASLCGDAAGCLICLCGPLIGGLLRAPGGGARRAARPRGARAGGLLGLRGSALRRHARARGTLLDSAAGRAGGGGRGAGGLRRRGRRGGAEARGAGAAGEAGSAAGAACARRARAPVSKTAPEAGAPHACAA